MNTFGVGRVWAAVGAWRLFVRCPVGLPWFRFRRDPGEHGQLLCRVQERERERVAGRSRTKAALAVLLWLALGVRELWRHHRQYRHLARGDPSAPGPWVRLGQAIRAWLGDNISPHEYYRYRLYRRENWIRRSAYFLAWQSHPLLVELDAARAGEVARAKDKLCFWQRCRELGLPTVPVVAAARAGRLVEPLGRELPAEDLVMKPVDGYGGLGVEFFFRVSSLESWTDGTRGFTAGELLARLCERAGAGGAILQPRVANHPATEVISNGFLVTLRLVSGRFPGGAPFLVAAACRMPAGAGRVANLSGGPVVAAIELETGRLAAAERAFPGEGLFELHPDSGGRIAGRPLPFWEESCELVLEAHRAFGAFPSIGWDVVLTPDGPLLLEFNTLWAPSILQVHGHAPLGSTLASACLLAHWRALRGEGGQGGAGADASVGRRAAARRAVPA